MTRQRAIALVPFPYSDLSGRKVRPALVLSSDRFNEREDVIICAMTSNIKERPYTLLIDGKNCIARKLKEKSQIRADTITRVKKSLILKEIDMLAEESFRKVMMLVKSVFE